MAQFRITPELYDEAVGFARRRARRLILAIVLMAFLLIALLDLRARGRLDWLLLAPPVVFFLFWFWGLPRIQRSQTRRIHSQQKSLQEPISLTLEEDALTWKAPSGNARVSWGDLHQWDGNDRLTVLYESEVLIRIIPHDALDPDELNLLKQKLQNVRKV